jgi:hypothetical protein
MKGLLNMSSILRATLEYKFKIGKYIGRTIQSVIDEDYSYVDFMHTKGSLTLAPDALCYLINKRTDEINRLSSFCDEARKENE